MSEYMASAEAHPPAKLFVPLLETDTLVRARLLEELDQGLGRPLILVSAPAGSGKTTLVADWVRRQDISVSWLSLDATDDDASSFVGHLAEALDAMSPGLGERPRAMLEASPPPDPMTIARTLVGEATASRVRGLVVLDDYHTISDPAIHEVVAFMIERGAGAPTFVLITRSDPPLPLPRLRVRRQLCEIRESHLRFREGEAAEIIQRFSGRRLREESIAALARRTEGWAAGLQLAALAMRQATDPDAFVSGFQGTHAFIADYLTDEVLLTLPEAQQRFVVRSSLLDRLSGPLCDAALETSGSQELLEELNRANLFLVPLDHERRWFRYHHLFADLLRRRSQQEPDFDRGALLARAAEWCAENGLIGDAVAYASRAGNAERAADLVAQNGVQALAAGEAYRALRWMHLIREELVASSPEHCVIEAWALSQVEDYARIRGLAERALEVGAADRPHPAIQNVYLHARLQRAGMDAMDGSGDALDEIMAVLAEAPLEDVPVRASAQIMAGKLLTFRGRYRDALTAHGEARDLGIQAGSDLLRLAGVTGVAETLLLRGQPARAAEVVRDELEDRRQLRDVLGSQVANLCAIEALAQIERARPDAAAEALCRCREALGYTGGDPDDWPAAARFGRVPHTAFHSSAAAAHYGFEAHVRLMLSQSKHDAAGRLLDSVEASLDPGASTEGVLVRSLRTRLLVARGDAVALQRLSHDPGASPGTGSAHWDEVAQIAAARAALAARDATTAVALLQPLSSGRGEAEGGVTTAEALVLHALAMAELGHGSDAQRSTIKALTVTGPEERYAPWLDAGPAVTPLLERVVSDGLGEGTEIAHSVTLLAMLRRHGPVASEAVHTLTDRELAVLRLIAAGHTNQEIAKALFLAVGTVKKHTHNIYGKLGVSNRTGAVNAARRQGILSEQHLPPQE